MNPVTKPISVVLKEARENKGISLEEAHKATKIHPKILRSLEEGTTLGLSHVYVKSYIKIYAKYLGISQQELDKYFLPSLQKGKKADIDLPFRTKGIKIKKLSNMQILFNLKIKIKKFKKPLLISIASLVIIVALGLIMSKLVKKRPKDTIVLGKVTLENKKPASLDVIKQKVERIVPQKNMDTLKLTIFAKSDVWIQIKKDGKVVFKHILNKSASETWEATERLELRIADAGAVELELNGKILPPLGRKGQPIKEAIITKEGLSIKK